MYTMILLLQRKVNVKLFYKRNVEEPELPRIEKIIERASGLHTRPSAAFVNLASQFPCDIQVRNVTRDSKFANGKSVLNILSMACCQNHVVEIKADGEGAGDALVALGALINDSFGDL